MEWWEKFFDARDGFIFLEPRIKETSREIDFIEDVLSLSKGAKILDLCCGLGRHSIELAERGYRVTGVDFLKEYLNIAREKAKESGIEIDFIQKDMREISFADEFDAVINMFTSFGYFEKEEDNLKVLKNVALSLKSNCKFLIDVVNRDWIIRNYKDRGEFDVGEYHIIDERRFDLAISREYSKRIFIRGKERVEKNICLRMYSFHELKSMLEKAGLKVIASYGSLEKDELTFDSNRMRIIAQKQ